MNKKSQTSMKLLAFVIIVIGGITVSFGNTNTIKVIGGLMIALGSAIASLY